MTHGWHNWLCARCAPAHSPLPFREGHGCYEHGRCMACGASSVYVRYCAVHGTCNTAEGLGSAGAVTRPVPPADAAPALAAQESRPSVEISGQGDLFA
jgi:hypothetical protein